MVDRERREVDRDLPKGRGARHASRGVSWNETPRLNADVVKAARRESYRSICSQLERGYARVLGMIDELSDGELLEVGTFSWAGKWPISRWISLNTVRQYSTARTFVRRAVRYHNG